MFKDRKSLVVHFWQHKAENGAGSDDDEEDEERKKKEQYMKIIRGNKIRIKRGDFGELPWFIENKQDEVDASAGGEIKSVEDRTKAMQPLDDDDDEDEEDEDEEEEEASTTTTTRNNAVDDKKKKKYLANFDDSTPGRSKRKASNVAKVSCQGPRWNLYFFGLIIVIDYCTRNS